MLNVCSFTAVAVTVVASVAHASPLVDQQQSHYDEVNDLSSGDTSGQTFTAGITGDLVGIRLVVSGAKWSGDYPFGADFHLRLRPLDSNGLPIMDEVLAHGFVERDGLIELDTPKWLTVLFDQPYRQSAGEQLAFMIEETSGGSAGWNNWGDTDDAYSGGTRFLGFYNGNDSFWTTDTDFAFETLVLPVPEPTGLAALALGAACLFGRRMSSTQLRLAAR